MSDKAQYVFEKIAALSRKQLLLGAGIGLGILATANKAVQKLKYKRQPDVQLVPEGKPTKPELLFLKKQSKDANKFWRDTQAGKYDGQDVFKHKIWAQYDQAEDIVTKYPSAKLPWPTQPVD